MGEKNEHYSELLKSTRAPHGLGLVGYGIVVFAILVSVVNALATEPIAFAAKILMPFIFVGIASLLYHIGQHVHALHLNALRMIATEAERSGEKSDHPTG